MPEAAPKVLEGNPETKVFSTEFIKGRIRSLLGSLDKVKKIVFRHLLNAGGGDVFLIYINT